MRSQRIRKSLGKETTFAEDILSVPELTNILLGLAEQVLDSLNKHNMQGRTVTVKVKYADFQQVTRAQTLDHSISFSDLKEWLPKLLARTEAGHKPVRLVGLSLSGFEVPVVVEKGQAQLDLRLLDEF